MAGEEEERVALTGGAVMDRDLYGAGKDGYMLEVVDEEMDDEPLRAG